MHIPDRVLFGAAYYAEYQDSPHDFPLMAAAGFTVIRVGESVWSTWEPEDGRFELDWMQPVLDRAHRHGIAVILGMPTYAVPPWLARRYPEIAGETATGQRVGWGARQEVDFTHAAFRFHAERVIRAILERYADHPAVIGFQVDNEPGFHLLHNHDVFQRFVEHLRRRYGSVEALNDAWGLVYWSHRLSDWSDLWRPDGNAQPQYDLAWRLFQGELTSEFIAWQAGIVRGYAGPDQFVTTCIAYELPAMDDQLVSGALDVTAGNVYYEMQDALRLPQQRRAVQKWRSSGAWALRMTADRMYASKQAPFLVTETNAAIIDDPWINKPGYDGQLRQAAWAMVARGAQMIEYWQWNTLHFGAETYWGGVLPHDGQPGRAYHEIARLGAELAAAGDLVTGLEPDNDVVLLYSTPSKWLMDRQPPLSDADGNPLRRAYHQIFDAFYKGAFDAGLQARIVHVQQALDSTAQEFAAEHPLLVVAGCQVAGQDLLDWLTAYAAAGGHLVLGPRTGYCDLEGRARPQTAPPGLSGPAGVRYSEVSNLSGDLQVLSPAESPLRLDDDCTATAWVESLEAGDAQILAGYDHPHFGRWAAVTTHQHGEGRITYVGTVPGADLARALFAWARPEPGTWTALPPSVTVSSAINRDGRRLHVIHNWDWQPQTLPAPVDLENVVTNEKTRRGETIELGAWDVIVTVED
ncbi:beta-galactosidase [Actinoplanes sp. NPDC000266]